MRVNGDVKLNNISVVKNGIIDVKEGDRIIAKGKSSFIQIKLFHEEVILLRDGELFVNKQEKKIGGQTLVELVKGKIFVSIEKSQKRKFYVKTKTAAMGVRGTKFMVEVKPKETYLCVCEGSVAMRNKKNEVLVAKGEDAFSSTDKTISKHEASDMMMKMTIDSFKEMGIPIDL